MKTYLVRSRTMMDAPPLVCNEETVKYWLDHSGMVCTEVVPASALHASEELVQRLANHVAALERTISQPGRRDEEVACVMNELFGLRKVEGRWVPVPGAAANGEKS